MSIEGSAWTPDDERWLASQRRDDEAHFARYRCRHCAKPPEADGDHSCPCPHMDADCPDHPADGAGETRGGR